MPPSDTKMIVELSPAAADELRKMAVKQRRTEAKVIRSALALEKFLREAKENGVKVLLEDSEGNLREVNLP